jgi:hypothetical protein
MVGAEVAYLPVFTNWMQSPWFLNVGLVKVCQPLFLHWSLLAAHTIRSRRIATETGCGKEISDGFPHRIARASGNRGRTATGAREPVC